MPQVRQDEGVTHAEFLVAFTMLAQIVTNLVNQGAYVPNVHTQALRVREFGRINPPELHGSIVDYDG